MTISICHSSPDVPVKFITDSRYVIDGLTKHLNDWENKGWTEVQNADWFRAAAYQLRHRTAPTFFQWVKGHSNNPGNEAADRLAKAGAQKDAPDHIDLSIPPAFDLPGLRLNTLSQRTIYRALTGRASDVPPLQSAQRNLDNARNAIHAISLAQETDPTLWKSTRHPDIRRPIQTFLYRAMNCSQRIGNFWSHIPGYQQRALCPLCHDAVEDLEHILTQCSSPERKTIWDLTKALWPPAYGPWPQVSIGTILGCGAITPPAPADQTPPHPAARGKARLLRILISESAHLIWAIRCERVVAERTLTESAIATRWLNKINNRLTMDRWLARRPNRPHAPSRTYYTWNPIIAASGNPPPNWATRPEVLVGITLPRPSA